MIGPAQAAYPDHDWATLAVWAWGAMRAVDYLITLPQVDPRRIVITGHSRSGKAALLAGALDERIALVAPQGSGCAGAASYRFHGAGAETLADVTRNFPYWFVPRLPAFAGKEERLPFDQHFLLALVAPRPLLTIDAEGDAWASPYGRQARHVPAPRPARAHRRGLARAARLCRPAALGQAGRAALRPAAPSGRAAHPSLDGARTVSGRVR